LSGRVSVILSTFNQPRPLALALRGYGRQTHSDFEVIVADDGSGPETAHVVQRAREQGLNVRHAWQDDRGFRKTEALNRAIGVARGAYLIFSDGDCIPRDDFVATHARLAEPDRFLSGGYLKLPESVTRAVDERAIDAEDVFDGTQSPSAHSECITRPLARCGHSDPRHVERTQRLDLEGAPPAH